MKTIANAPAVLTRLWCVTEPGDWHLQCVDTLWQCLCHCWQDDIYLARLCHRFWKLSLQLLARYTTALADTMATEVGFNYFYKNCFQDRLLYSCNLQKYQNVFYLKLRFHPKSLVVPCSGDDSCVSLFMISCLMILVPEGLGAY